MIFTKNINFRCYICNKKIVTKRNLVRHEKGHLEEKLYKCSFCNKAFSRKAYCSIHEEKCKQIGKKSFKCEFPDCNQRFDKKVN